MNFTMRLAYLIWASAFEERHRSLVDLLLEMVAIQDRLLREANGGHRKQLTDEQRLRLAIKAKKVPRDLLAGIASQTYSPETFLRWYRQLANRRYDGSISKNKGRPRIKASTVKLIIRLAQENPDWGYRRIVGELKKLGITLSKNSVARVLTDAGIEPSPSRRKGLPWFTFLKRHWETLYSIDFFTVEVLRGFGFMRMHVAIVMELAKRRVHLAGIVPEPDQAWTVQMARNLTDYEEGILKNATHLIHDRASVFGAAFRRTLANADVETVKLPPRSPNLSAHLERFNRSIKDECLNHFVICSQDHLEHLVKTYIAFYNEKRPHHGMNNDPLTPQLESCGPRIERQGKLGGLLNHYERTAA